MTIRLTTGQILTAAQIVLEAIRADFPDDEIEALDSFEALHDLLTDANLYLIDAVGGEARFDDLDDYNAVAAVVDTMIKLGVLKPVPAPAPGPAYDVLTIETTPFSPRPTCGGREAMLVTLTGGWLVSHASSNAWEGHKLNVYRPILDEAGGYVGSRRHGLDGTISATKEESDRLAYNAGLLGYMVYRPGRAPWERHA